MNPDKTLKVGIIDVGNTILVTRYLFLLIELAAGTKVSLIKNHGTNPITSQII